MVLAQTIVLAPNHGASNRAAAISAPRLAMPTQNTTISSSGARLVVTRETYRCEHEEVTTHLHALCFDANDPARLADFWGSLLGWERSDDDGVALLPTDDTGFRIRMVASPEPKVEKNRMHFDLTSATPEKQQKTVATALDLGARHIDVGQRPEEGHVVLADPEGNEFCVIEAGNSFLADCGFVGALACDGSQAVGYFWAEALGWPLVWDEDQETAIRSPHGGPKITWGGEQPPAQPVRNRLRFELAAEGVEVEVDRLLALGATDLGRGHDGRAVLADPDGNAFWVRG
jgi:predicted enzyme related to lactoylglutathione lyase